MVFPKYIANFMNDLTEELIGSVEKIIFRSDDTGYTVFLLRMKQQTITATGRLTSLDPEEYVRMLGRWTQHKTYGRQFSVIRKVPHTTEDGIRRYLTSRTIKGIGLKTAGKIVKYFGDKTLDILDHSPSRVGEVPTIGAKKTQAIVEAWEPHRQSRLVDLFLSESGLSPSLATNIINHFGAETIEILTANPYRLVELPRIGFISADTFAGSLGIDPESKERIKAATLHALRRGEEAGHCFQTTSDLLDHLTEITKLPMESLESRLPDCLFDLNQAQRIISVNLPGMTGDVGSAHYLKSLHYAEKAFARKVRELLSIPADIHPKRVDAWLDHFLGGLEIPLSKDQIEAVRKAALSKVFVLTGGPGVGKSTTAKAILNLLSSQQKEVALCAPTGRAAQRLMEVTGHKAKTIHRLLEWGQTAGQFQRNHDNPIEASVVVVDEASMLDIQLANALIDAISPKTQVIFIGDVDQLPSVGPGNVLKDLIDSKVVPFTRLEEIFRQAAQSEIIRSSHAINSSILPDFSNDKESDCRFIEVEGSAESLHVIERLVHDILPKKTPFDPFKDIQILTPMKRTELGTVNLNERIQSILNPKRKDVREYESKNIVLRQNDKVIQCTNNYDLGVFNGDIGLIVDASVQKGKVMVEFGRRVVTYSSEEVGQLQLAYAITIHKSQGSEFPVVIIPISTQHFVMLQKNLVYTALTRAKKLAIFVGTKKALQLAATTQVSQLRRTNLQTLLRGEAEVGL